MSHGGRSTSRDTSSQETLSSAWVVASVSLAFNRFVPTKTNWFLFCTPGLQLVLWFLCTSCLWKQRSRGRHPGLLIFLVLLIATETIFAVSQARTIQMMYIEHRDHEGGPWQYYLDVQDSVVVVMLHASLFVLTFLGDVLVVSKISDNSKLASSDSLPAMALLGSLESI